MSRVVTELKTVATREFGLTVDQLLPIGESFASDVIRFQHGSRQYVLKRPFTVEKAKREHHWLNALRPLACVPESLGFKVVADQGYVLMTSLSGMPLSAFQGVSDSDLVRLGVDIKRIHQTVADDFDGFSQWHQLLMANLERYMSVLIGQGNGRFEQACDRFLKDLGDLPNSSTPTATHFDLRAGNMLFEQGRYVGIIDFESMRGGHPSMDFFKLVTKPSDLQPAQLALILKGYGPVEWMATSRDLIRLVSRYRIYHGLAGLAWCVSRGQGSDTEFYKRSIRFLEQGMTEHRS